jgi:hypothetical protein
MVAVKASRNEAIDEQKGQSPAESRTKKGVGEVCVTDTKVGDSHG